MDEHNDSIVVDDVPLFAQLGRPSENNDIDKAAFDNLLLNNVYETSPLSNPALHDGLIVEDTLSPRSDKAKAKEYGKIKPSQNVTRTSTSSSAQKSKTICNDDKKQKSKKPKTKVSATNDNKDSGHNDKSDDVFCYDDCKHGGAWKQKMMIRCILCMKWIHYECSGDSDSDLEISGSWCCDKCRNMPHSVNSIMKQLCDENVTLQKRLLECISERENLKIQLEIAKSAANSPRRDGLDMSLQQQNVNLISTNNLLMNELAKSNNELRELRSRNERLTEEQSKVQGTNQKDAGLKNLIIGSSIIRDFHAEAIENADVTCMSGAKCIDISNELRRKNKKYNNVTVVIGGNDCDKCLDTDKITKDMLDVVSNAKSCAQGSVKISSICPRTNNPDTQSRIDAVNKRLKESSNISDFAFIDNENIFRLQDGSINDGYLLNDGVHLTSRGSEKLATNLGVPRTAVWHTVRRNHGSKSTLTNQSQYVSEGRLGSLKYNERVRPIRTSTNPPNSISSRMKDRANDHQNQGYSYRNAGRPRCCWNCGETGHVVSSCKHGEPIQCFSCKRSGHKAKFCDRYLQ